MEDEKKIGEKPKEEEPLEEKPAEDKPKDLKIIIFTSSDIESCKPALDEVKRVAEEEKVEVEEIDTKGLEFPKDVIEGGGIPTTCVISKGEMKCHVGFGPKYKQKLLEMMKKLRERVKSG